MAALHWGQTAPDPDTLMLHCTLARHESLLPLARAAGLRAVLPDLLGHGRSPAWDGQGDYQTANLDAILPMMDRPMHVIGHSFGGTVALRLAVTRPDLVTRLTLIEPVFFALANGTPAGAQHAAIFGPIYDAVAAGDPDRAAQLFHAAYGMGQWDKLPQRTRMAMAAGMPLVIASAPAIQDDIHGVAARLPEITVPVTLIGGSDSQPVVTEIHKALAQIMPQANAHVIAGAGHMATLTHPDRVAALI
ncbi:alpha/beta hydrolase [Loktanella sp. SALINAS62]|uniref:alpha/beta fold hydrolase n=1 Tax=Loktanella sp. SALINAS62 TaxID=2706124 RepID=UPI001B8C9F27|nr:alpha/beta hydrolase [Loktanella sp. SALINAS62]MBS1301300.1 alpha/beta hydrolase [Loktanella sp. SALINAS62]